MLHVKTGEIYGKNEIVNANDTRKHLVNIDSRFRNSLAELSTDFLYSFAHPYKNVIQARVASVEIPFAFYHFSKAKKNTMFRIDAMDWVGGWHFLPVTIPDGDYTAECLVETIQEQFDGFRDVHGIFFRILYDARARRVTIVCDGSGPPPCPPGPSHFPAAFGLTFAMVGLEKRAFDFGLGFNLGFAQHFYTVVGSITGESVVTLQSDAYFLLAIDDWHTVEHKTNETYVQCLAKILLKRGENGFLFDDGYTVLSNDIVFPRPVDLKQVRVRLLDAFGEVVDLHRSNFSISLEISEVMNVQLYEEYRGYLWGASKEALTGTRPVPRGAASALAGRVFN